MKKNNSIPKWVVVLICIIVSLLLIGSKSLAPGSDSLYSELPHIEESTNSLTHL